MRANRIEARFEALQLRKRKAFTAFITAGDPDRETTRRAMHALVEGGADLIELGIPFSDPESDGPTIQAASQRALSGPSPTRLRDVLEIARGFRRRDTATPLVLMGYLNSLLAMGIEAFTKAAPQAGVDGVVLVNLPVEAFEDVEQLFTAANLCVAFLVAPTTAKARMERIAANARGFLYYVSLKGVTGAAHLDFADLSRSVTLLRSLCTLPIQVGFGIHSPEVASRVAPLADGLIVGSDLVAIMADLRATPEKIPAALRIRAGEFRSAIDAAS